MARVRPITDRPLISAAELERMGDLLEPCELWDGVVVVGEPATPYADWAGSAILAAIRAHTLPRRLGWVFGASAGFQVGSNPDRVLSPDVAFVRRDRIPSLPRRGYVSLVPDLVVEVRSPSQTWAYTIERGGIWIAHGAKVVWLIDPEPRSAWVLRPMAEPVEVGPDAVLPADPAIEGWSLPLADVFEGLG
jgi:Uma2 family endonuclease